MAPSADPFLHPMSAGQTKEKGPFAGETRTDAWLFEHSKFLRNHFKHNHQDEFETKSKHDMLRRTDVDVQGRGQLDEGVNQEAAQERAYRQGVEEGLDRHPVHNGNHVGFKSNLVSAPARNSPAPVIQANKPRPTSTTALENPGIVAGAIDNGGSEHAGFYDAATGNPPSSHATDEIHKTARHSNPSVPQSLHDSDLTSERSLLDDSRRQEREIREGV